MLTVCYINRQPGRGYHYSQTNACGQSTASKKLSFINRNWRKENIPVVRVVSCHPFLYLLTPVRTVLYYKAVKAITLISSTCTQEGKSGSIYFVKS